MRLTYWKTLGGGVCKLSVVAEREKLGVEAIVGSNLSVILMRSESLPYVLMILTVLVGGLEGARMELLERL